MVVAIRASLLARYHARLPQGVKMLGYSALRDLQPCCYRSNTQGLLPEQAQYLKARRAGKGLEERDKFL